MIRLIATVAIVKGPCANVSCAYSAAKGIRHAASRKVCVAQFVIVVATSTGRALTGRLKLPKASRNQKRLEATITRTFEATKTKLNVHGVAVIVDGCFCMYAVLSQNQPGRSIEYVLSE